ncbi:hypothetical protein RGQ15_13825 [Paracoccus sp. MBLB3053]|uniref:Small multidrug resistance protein n=1 Tax=Paracoccus aurantius TaxID=3073814 RepID=A0ABU2HUB7_9RHOB|nr:hypothetical protein [Paracoccus sp. MBLB3053]MDS9468642.1 hypothetical protein [Paracoccus sp. MBLB3053]
MNHWLLIFIAAAANVVLNLCLKQGGRDLNTAGLVPLVGSIFVSPWMWAAVGSAVILLSAFVAAVRVYSLSLTYTAVTALAMVTLTGLGIALQQEALSLGRLAGLALIVGGLIVIAISSSAA